MFSRLLTPVIKHRSQIEDAYLTQWSESSIINVLKRTVF